MRSAQLSLDNPDLDAELDTGTLFETGQQHMISIESEFFVFESMVRPDRTVVLHLRNLRRDFRNKKMMDYLAQWIRDRIGGFDSFKADFLSEIGNEKGAYKINSMDFFIRGYTPALVHDDRFVVRHLTNLGRRLIEHIRGKL